MNQTQTTDIGRGVEYAMVKDRLIAFHEQHEQCSVETTCEFKEGFVLFSARVTTKKGAFTGHSMSKVSAKKDFEKQETIAVGRALAFAGFLASGAIASQEEMEDFCKPDVVTTEAINALKVAYAKHFAPDLVDLDKDHKAIKFYHWVAQITGGDFDPREFTQWSMDDLAACNEALR